MPLSPDRRTDDRRRRLLQGEILSSEAARDEAEAQASNDPGRTPRRSKTNFPRYAKAADMSQQARVTDLVPQRKLTLWILFLAGLAVVAGLECLYYWMPNVVLATRTSSDVLRDNTVAAFDLDGEGSLAAWFSSFVLAGAALTAVLVFTLRRHLLDDYRGRYRIWLWAAACWFVMSIDESASLHEGFKELVVYFSGKRLYGDGSVWWVIGYGSMLATVGLLLLWDMRRSWFSSLAFVACGLCYAAAVVLQLELHTPRLGAWPVQWTIMAEEACEMVGNLLLLLAMATHARFLIRDIQGLNKKPKKKRATNSKPAAEAPAKAAMAPLSAATAAASAKKVTVQMAQARKPQPQEAIQNKHAKDQRGMPARPQQNRKAA
jgi:hypothetical protein